MSLKPFLLAGAFVALSLSVAEAQVTFKFITADDAAKMAFDKARAKEAGNVAKGDANFSMALAQRIQSGHTEKHMNYDEELVMQEGDVLLTYGGNGVNAKETRPGEWNADSISGGTTVEMHPGDIVVIPANTWHLEVLKSPRMRYVLIHSSHKE
jgi:mannose-6-phosphate isomerase-like protein (cupin superfamily)